MPNCFQIVNSFLVKPGAKSGLPHNGVIREPLDESVHLNLLASQIDSELAIEASGFFLSASRLFWVTRSSFSTLLGSKLHSPMRPTSSNQGLCAIGRLGIIVPLCTASPPTNVVFF
ncbi:hypothetical protein FKM82_018342 [Ascaphus truei]